MADVPVFDLQLTEAVANILAATEHPGLTATELTSALRPVRLELDPDTSLNKRTRLLHTLHNAHRVSRAVA